MQVKGQTKHLLLILFCEFMSFKKMIYYLLMSIKTLNLSIPFYA